MNGGTIIHCVNLFRENRHVLFLTENYAALDILKNSKNYLSDDMLARPGTEPDEGPARDIHPFILFGSSFPKDKVYTQVILCDVQCSMFWK